MVIYFETYSNSQSKFPVSKESEEILYSYAVLEYGVQ